MLIFLKRKDFRALNIHYRSRAKIEREKNQLGQIEKLYQDIQNPSLSKQERKKLLNQELKSYVIKIAYRSHLIMHNDFQNISTFLDSITQPKSMSKQIFHAVCLEKVQNIDLSTSELRLAIENLACMWNLYCQSPNCIFRNENCLLMINKNKLLKLFKKK